MNMRHQSVQGNPQNIIDDRHRAGDHGDLLPWADPYIASLFRQHDPRMLVSTEAKQERRTA